MGLYEKIARHYDSIFPTSPATVDFISKCVGETPKDVLDVACGTGGYSLELVKRGYNLTAIDLNSKMIEELKTRAKKLNLEITCAKCNMLETSKMFAYKFDAAFCIGNSIVHLNSKEQIEKFFKDIYQVLSSQGKFIAQIVNFDRIFIKNVKSLPTIQDNEIGLIFERFYEYNDRSEVNFKTVLSVENEKMVNEINLTPIFSEEIFDMLTTAGFSKVEFYGDFNFSNYNPENSKALIVVAEKR